MLADAVLDLGHGHVLTFTCWEPDRQLNPQFADLPDVARYGATIAHPRPDGTPCPIGGGLYFDGDVQRRFHPAEHLWTVESWAPLTIRPSVLCLTCGDHGFITEGAVGAVLITIHRRPTIKVTTLGKLAVDGVPFCDTLEDKIREVPGDPVASWKIHSETAIPAGRYRCLRHMSPTHGPVIMLTGIPGFDLVYIHAGNDDADTKGCILVGEAVEDPQGDGGDIKGGTSRPARARLEKQVFATMATGEEVWCEIKNPLTTRAT